MFNAPGRRANQGVILKVHWLDATAAGDLPKSALLVLGVLSLILASSCLYLVQASLPEHALAAHFGLTLLFLGALCGFLVLLQLLLKLVQGPSVRLRAPK